MIASNKTVTVPTLTIQDDSMAPEILCGDILYISEDIEFKSGGVGVVCIHDSSKQRGCDWIARRVFITEEGRAILKSYNPKYPEVEKSFGHGEGEIAKIYHVTGLFRRVYSEKVK